jgi:DNA-binding protein Fis
MDKLSFDLAFKNVNDVYSDLLHYSVRNNVANDTIIHLLSNILANIKGVDNKEFYKMVVDDMNAEYAKQMADFVNKYCPSDEKNQK